MLKFILRISLFLMSIIMVQTSYANSKGLQRQQEALRFGNETKVAVVVGVNDYDTPSGLRPLQYAVADATSLKSTLEKQGYSVRLLLNQQANSSYILDAIKQAGKTLDPNQGTLIFAFSGHGFADNKTNYLASYGTVMGNLDTSALSMTKVVAAIKKTGARRGVMFIDACRDNPSVIGSKSIVNASFVHQQSEGLQILYSTKLGGVSWETPKLKHGVFSYFLQKALNGGAADNNGLISFDQLKQYVQKQVASWTFSNLGKTQKPYNVGENYGVFVLGHRYKIIEDSSWRLDLDRINKKIVSLTRSIDTLSSMENNVPSSFPQNNCKSLECRLDFYKKEASYSIAILKELLSNYEKTSMSFSQHIKFCNNENNACENLEKDKKDFEYVKGNVNFFETKFRKIKTKSTLAKDQLYALKKSNIFYEHLESSTNSLNNSNSYMRSLEQQEHVE